MLSKQERGGKPQVRGKKKKAKHVELDPKPTDSAFFSHSWLPTAFLKSWCQKLLIGLVLTAVNVVLLFYNLDAFESRPIVYKLSPTNNTAVAAPPPSQSAGGSNLRGTREVSKQSAFQEIKLPTAPAESVHTLPPPPVPDVNDLIAFALAQNTTQMIKFRSPSWSLSTMTLSPGQQLPYQERYSGVNQTFGEYLGHDNVVFLSACSSKELRDVALDLPFGDVLKEKAAFMQMQCEASRVEANMRAKEIVVYVNFRESGYYGHAIDNILPRIFTVMPGLVQSGHKLVLVLPPLGRRSLSENTKVLCQMLGIEVLQVVPSYPHRTIGLSGVSSWSRETRQTFQRAVWASPLLQGSKPATCDPWMYPPWQAESSASSRCPCRFDPGIFLGRSGARNSRPVQGAEDVEKAFEARGFELVPNAEVVPLQQLAQKLYSSCSLVGFSGTAMVNLIFLPPAAAVADLNPYLIYANSWLWSHALGYCFCQIQPPKKGLEQPGQAAKLASVLLGNLSSVEKGMQTHQHPPGSTRIRQDPPGISRRQVDDLKKQRQRAHVRSLLQLCCEPTDVEELTKDRLQVFKTLAARDTRGLEREVLLACGHSNRADLQILCSEGQGLPGSIDRYSKSDPITINSPVSPSLESCQACDRLTRPREVSNSLRLAQQRCQKAQEKATRRWRLLQILLEAKLPVKLPGISHLICSATDVPEAAGLPSPDDASLPMGLCDCGASHQAARLMACGHVACPGHETCNCEGKEVAVSLDFRKCEAGFKDSSVCSKIDGIVSSVQKVLSESPKVQCLIFSQWTSTLRKLEEALRAQGLEPFVPSLPKRKAKKAPKSIVLLTPDFLCSEKRDRHGEHGALDEHAATRHVFLTNPFCTGVKAEVLEQRIVDFAKTNQLLGVSCTAILHRFLMSDTIETSGELKEAVEAWWLTRVLNDPHSRGLWCLELRQFLEVGGVHSLGAATNYAEPWCITSAAFWAWSLPLQPESRAISHLENSILQLPTRLAADCGGLVDSR
eukprot:Skav234786  [mRNA]  locus=scaffold69:46519:64099:+ [translate_table: standard]